MRKGFVVLAVLFVGSLCIARMLLPNFIKRKVNEKLTGIPGYVGHVDDVTLDLWRGAISLQKINIKHTEGDVTLAITDLDFQIDWLPLFRHVIVAEVTVEAPEFSLVVANPIKAAKKTQQAVQKAKDTAVQETGLSLPDLLASIIPFKISRLDVRHGKISVRDKDPARVDWEGRISDLNVLVTNLTNIQKEPDHLTASAKASAKIMDESPIDLRVTFNPLAKEPQFHLDLALEKLPLTELNPLLDWQWGIAVKEGNFSLFSQSAAQDGRFKGYLKPLLQNVKIGKRPKRNPGQVIKEVVAKVVVHIFKNNDTQTVGTEVPFQGRFDNPHVGIWEAIVEVLRNAFIEALRPQFDPHFHF